MIPPLFLVFASGGHRLISASAAGRMHAWWVGSWNEDPVPKSIEKPYPLMVLGNELVIGSQSGTIHAFETRYWGDAGRLANHHLVPITTLALSPDGQHIFSADDFGSNRLWQRDHQGQWKCVSLLDTENHIVLAAIFEADGRLLVSDEDTDTLRRFDILSAPTAQPAGFIKTLSDPTRLNDIVGVIITIFRFGLHCLFDVRQTPLEGIPRR